MFFGLLVQWSKKQFVKPEFEVAKRMVGLLYFQVWNIPFVSMAIG